MPDENSNGGVQSNQSTAQNQSGNDFVLDFGDEEKEDKIIKQENQEVIKQENLPEDLGQDTEFKVDINPETPTEENSINPENETEIEEEKDSQDESFDISFDTDSDNEENKDNTEENGENDSQSSMDDNESVEKSDKESLKFDDDSSEGDTDQPLEFTFDDNTVENSKPTEENKLEDDFSDSEELNQNPDENIEDGDNNLFKEDDNINVNENINSEENNNIYVEDKVDEKSNSEEENLNSEDLFEENDEDLNTNSDETTENIEDNIVTDEEDIEEKDIDDSEENQTISFQNEEYTPNDSGLNNTEENNGIVLDLNDESSQNMGQTVIGEADNQESISDSEEEKIVDDENMENESDESTQFNFAEDNLEDDENEEINDVNNNSEDIIEENQSELDFVVDFNSEDNSQNNIEDNSEDDSQDTSPENEEQETQIQPDIQTFEQEQNIFEGQKSYQDVQSEIKQPEISDLLGDESTNIPSNDQNNQLLDDNESPSPDFTLSPSENNKSEATLHNITESGENSINNEDNNPIIQENPELQQNVPTIQSEVNTNSNINEQSLPQSQLDTDIVNNQNNPQNNVNETVNNQPETLEMKSTLSLDQILDSELTNNPQFMNESKANSQNVVSNVGFFKKNLVGIVIGVSLFVLAGFVAILAFPSKTTERKTGDTVAIQTPEEGHFAGGEQDSGDGGYTQTGNDGIDNGNYDNSTGNIYKSQPVITFPDVGEPEDGTGGNGSGIIEPYLGYIGSGNDQEMNTNTITADEILEVISDFKSAAEKYYSQGDLLQDKKLTKYSLQAINLCDVYKNQVEKGEGISQEELDNFKSRITTSIAKIETYMGGTEDIDLFVQDGSQDSYDFKGEDDIENFRKYLNERAD